MWQNRSTSKLHNFSPHKMCNFIKQWKITYWKWKLTKLSNVILHFTPKAKNFASKTPVVASVQHCHFCKEVQTTTAGFLPSNILSQIEPVLAVILKSETRLSTSQACVHTANFTHIITLIFFSKALRLSDLITNIIFPHCGQLLDAIPYPLYICAWRCFWRIEFCN